MKFVNNRKAIKVKTERDVEHRIGIKSEPKNSIQPVKAESVETERDVERRIGIKSEPNNSIQPVQAESVSNVADWNTEKKSLIEKILALKTENNKCVLNLKKTQAECATLLREKQKLEQKLLDVEKVIADLKKNNQLLLAQNKQYRAGIERKSCADKENEVAPHNATDQLYEVHSILKHKDSKTGRKYLIRWEGYGSDEDSWEREENLACPEILNQYIRSINDKSK